MKFRIWDLPLRTFHWLLVLTILCSFVTVKIGGNAMTWHARFGYLVIALMSFRFIWGFMGSYHARFINFIKSPKSIVEYLKNPLPSPGHSPLGAVAVVILITLFTAQAIAGLFASDDIAFDGPMAKFVPSYWVELLTSLHRLNEPVLLGLILIHVTAIIYYRIFKKQDLIKPMLTGDKDWTEKIPVSRDDLFQRVVAAFIFSSIIGVLYYFLR